MGRCEGAVTRPGPPVGMPGSSYCLPFNPLSIIIAFSAVRLHSNKYPLTLWLNADAIASAERSRVMLWTIAVILIILWLLGFISGYTIGGFIHVLLVIAIIVVLVRIIQGRRPF
jgi:hypothetical protein